MNVEAKLEVEASGQFVVKDMEEKVLFKGTKEAVEGWLDANPKIVVAKRRRPTF